MSRLHLVTSHRPLPGAVTSADTLVFMDAAAGANLIDQVLAENPQITSSNLRVIVGEVEAVDQTEPRELDYKGLVELVASSDSVVSW